MKKQNTHCDAPGDDRPPVAQSNGAVSCHRGETTNRVRISARKMQQNIRRMIDTPDNPWADKRKPHHA
ncbi:hypothetical protein ACMA5I_03650 [Paracoccaceae bacterium GXU_MW_L88]